MTFLDQAINDLSKFYVELETAEELIFSQEKDSDRDQVFRSWVIGQLDQLGSVLENVILHLEKP